MHFKFFIFIFVSGTRAHEKNSLCYMKKDKLSTGRKLYVFVCIQTQLVVNLSDIMHSDR